MTLAASRLTLRPLRPADATWIAREIARPEVHRWLPSVPYPYREAQTAEFITTYAEQPGYRVIDLENAPAGIVKIDVSGPPELGFWLEPAAWGQGIMTEAAMALLAWYDQTYGGEVHSGYLDGNLGSARVLQKLGFLPVGTVSRHASFLGRRVTSHRMRRPAPQ